MAVAAFGTNEAPQDKREIGIRILNPVPLPQIILVQLQVICPQIASAVAFPRKTIKNQRNKLERRVMHARAPMIVPLKKQNCAH